MIDVSKPSNSRVYSYLLGGKDNFAVDREAAERMLTRDPGLRQRARLNRAFVTGATKRATRAGIAQFLDLGSGLPVHPSVDEVVRVANPVARVAYVDSDPVVFSHTNALSAVEEGIVAALADFRDPAAVLAHPDIREAIDLSEPTCVILAAVSHLLPPARVADIAAGYMRALPAGSWLVVSTEYVTDEALRAPLATLYGVEEVYNHGPVEVASFFRDLDLVEPGIAEARRWLSGLSGVSVEPGQPGYVLCAAGIKPNGQVSASSAR